MRRLSLTLAIVFTAALSGGCGSQPPPRPVAWSQPIRAPHRPLLRARDTVRVMSFNLRQPVLIDGPNHWDHRKDEVAQIIESFSPDVLGTQECELSQALFIKQRFAHYGFVGAGREDGRAGGEMCAIFYRRDRFQKLEDGHFWLSNSPQRPGSKSWGTSYPRMTSWAKLRERQSGRVFFVFNTHLDNGSGRARSEGARLLRWQIDAISGGEPVVLTGDFNSGPGQAPYVTLVHGLHRGAERLIDTFRQFGGSSPHGEGTLHAFRGHRGGDRIDWILTSPGFRTITAGIDRSRIGGRYPSDHFPVTAVVALEEPLRAVHAEPRGGGARQPVYMAGHSAVR